MLLLLLVVELLGLLHLELLGLLSLHHPHLRVLDLLLRHASTADALAHGRSRHHTPARSYSTRSRHAAEAASPSPLGAGERMRTLTKGQVLLPGGLLLVGDEALDDSPVGGTAGAHPRRPQAGPATGATTSSHTTGTPGSTTGRRRVGRDVVKVRVGGLLGHHTGGGHTVVAVGGSTTPTSSSAAATTSRNARSNHGLELSDAIVSLLDLGLQFGDLHGIARWR